MKRVLILNTTNASTSSGHLMVALGEALADNGAHVDVQHLITGQGLKAKLSRIFLPSKARRLAFKRADIIIAHTSVLFSAWEIICGRMFGKPVYAIYWDSYPESFAGLGRKQSRATTHLFGLVERALLRLCNELYPPSHDYLKHMDRLGLAARAEVLPMWPFTPVSEPRKFNARHRIQIGFAGAVNPIRGVEHALKTLRQATDAEIELHTYGAVKPELAANETTAAITHVHHGFVPQDEIMARLRRHDFGLVSLHPDFSLPAFPSKSLSYICAGLPVLYVGPAMPAFEALLSETGIGLTVKPGDRIDLVARTAEIWRDIPASQQRALAHLRLNEERLAKILQ